LGGAIAIRIACEVVTTSMMFYLSNVTATQIRLALEVGCWWPLIFGDGKMPSVHGDTLVECSMNMEEI
jgi:hypothetical protein